MKHAAVIRDAPRESLPSAPRPPHRPGARRQSVNITLDADLVAHARELGVTLSPLFEEALARKVKEIEAERWLEENKEAIEAYNAYIAKHGTFAASLRRRPKS